MEAQETKEHKQGKPWKIVSKCKTHEEAAVEKNKILTDSDSVDVKIKFSNLEQLFVVKTRNKQK